VLTGEYYPTIDSNGRLAFPSKLRDELGDRFCITRWIEDCLVVFSETEWDIICERIKAQPYSETIEIRRYLFPNACTVEPDKQGRVIIPVKLRELSGITDDVVIVGIMDRAEIWAKEKWLTEQDKMNSSIFSAKLKEIGI